MDMYLFISKIQKIALWNYSQPQKGGSFILNKDFIDKYDIFETFIKCKINCAYILEAMYGKLQLHVQPLCRKDIFSLVKESEQLCFINEGTINYIMLKNSYSVVAYPVGYHIDTFKENKPSFENKICFIQSKCSMSCRGEGRGGAGGGNYVWALLDW